MHENFIAFKGFCPKYIIQNISLTFVIIYILHQSGEDMHGWESLLRSKEHGQKSHSLSDISFSKLLV